ncbi:hypothetical protein FA95DRAFT_1565183 [Auriscalpium vulgare]|uniref:Uncharacterized protein n=1 Tax=Auriscalpium vulgare TaxID=40419 RepID=A0ACB8RBZ1_9AGAM|nr:hypothetical protein FA95DRAFT_1565183 [Auriscalpium vulgare]
MAASPSSPHEQLPSAALGPCGFTASTGCTSCLPGNTLTVRSPVCLLQQRIYQLAATMKTPRINTELQMVPTGGAPAKSYRPGPSSPSPPPP